MLNPFRAAWKGFLFCSYRIVTFHHVEKDNLMATLTAECPECGATIALENVMRGEIVVCPECGAELEVVSVDPLVLEPAPMEQEDWGE
jgi:alpha-aminoadipate/glutamate carrier protein LysW